MNERRRESVKMSVIERIYFGTSSTETHRFIIRSNHDPQIGSTQFELELMSLPCDHEFMALATPNKNAYIESFFSTLEYALLAKSNFKNFAEAYKAVVDCIEFYNAKRIDASIKMSPHKLKASWQTLPQMTEYSVSA